MIGRQEIVKRNIFIWLGLVKTVKIHVSNGISTPQWGNSPTPVPEIKDSHLLQGHKVRSHFLNYAFRETLLTPFKLQRSKTPTGGEKKKPSHTERENCFSLHKYTNLTNPLCNLEAGNRRNCEARAPDHYQLFSWWGGLAWAVLWGKVGWQDKARRKLARGREGNEKQEEKQEEKSRTEAGRNRKQLEGVWGFSVSAAGSHTCGEVGVRPLLPVTWYILPIRLP